jgi:hypothetical protein
MEGGLVVKLVYSALPNRVVLDDLLHDVGEEGWLLSSLGVLVLDDSLRHEVVDVVFFLQISRLKLRLDVYGTDAVLEAFGKLPAVFSEGEVGVLALDDDFVGPDSIGPDQSLLHLGLNVVNQMVGCFVLIEEHINLFGDRLVISLAKLVNTSLYVFFFPILSIVTAL